ncbi:LITAF-like zinc ribbon domain containing protein [Nitzschia inconspicua]|uniref:LITAF-like zinc ribbon domain containing protein n=1 Tax=Nitzschia inconspicua TaxID=303405 RepID=A0A9K3KQ63_9STRA|nr:LITAF-like zinc ribbon domain containing protein [Nitzschia inconspicua]
MGRSDDYRHDGSNQTDIPTITDSEVVDAEAIPFENPPPRNPNYVSTVSSPLSNTNTQSSRSLKQKQQYTQSHPVAVTAMVPTNNIASQTPKTIKTLGRNATGLICPHCQRQTVTVVEDYVGVGTVLAVIVLAILFWPICWLPLCVPTCKRTHHYCGQQTCQRKVGETRVCA